MSRPPTDVATRASDDLPQTPPDELRRLNEALFRREQLLKEAQAMAHLGNFEWNVVTQALWWSDEMYRIHHWDPAGTPITIENTVALVVKSERKGVRMVLDRVLRTGISAALDFAILLPDGRIRNMHGKAGISSDPLTGDPCVVGCIQDITDRKMLETGLVAADRLATVGLLAAGVAHEINNPLVNVVSNLSYLREDLSQLAQGNLETSRTALLEMLSDIEHGATQIRDLVEALRTFSGSEQLSLASIDVHRLLDIVTALVQPELRNRAQLEKAYHATSLMVRANESKLGQVLIHLLVNAAQAIVPGTPSKHRVRLRTQPAGDDRIAIEVSDTGSGMSPEVQARLFTPFFSTKAVGTGKGLGLSISRSIVEQHGGRIEFESKPGEGSTFRVLLPRDSSLSTTTQVLGSGT